MKRGTVFLRILICSLPLMCVAQSQDDYDKRIVDATSFNTYSKVGGLNQPEDVTQIVGAHTISFYDKVAFSNGAPPAIQPVSLASTPGTAQTGLTGLTGQQQTQQLSLQQSQQQTQPQTQQQTQVKPKVARTVRKLGVSTNDRSETLQDALTKNRSEFEHGTPKEGALNDMDRHAGQTTEIDQLLDKAHELRPRPSNELKKILKVVVKPASERTSERQLLDLLKNINPRENKLAAAKTNGFDEFFPVI